MNPRGFDRETLRRMSDVSKSFKKAWEEEREKCYKCNEIVPLVVPYIWTFNGYMCGNCCRMHKPLPSFNFSKALVVWCTCGGQYHMRIKGNQWCDLWEEPIECEAVQIAYKAYEKDYEPKGA